MCGIAGFLRTSADRSAAELEDVAERMARTLVHRGPDSGGTWVDEAAGMAMAHRRLAILDLTPDGAQPMRSETGRFIVSFNGEIYNYVELREQLTACGHGFRGHSDTEVLLAAVEQWGFVGALERFNGMFALALWDQRERVLHIARDRMGEKPLYYGWFGDTFLFASELKALRVHPDFNGSIDRDVLTLLMRHGYVPAPYSIYEGVRKLAPASFLTVSPRKVGAGEVAQYWSLRDAAMRGTETRFAGTPTEAVAELETRLRDAVRLRMHADVPLGAFLSGGIDSSTVVALMQAQSTRPVRTFTIGFHEDGYDEARHAKAVAEHLGTDHTELYVSARDALDVIPRLPTFYDEPFADSSQIPTFLVSQLTRRHVTVSLSGDGGDEIFCGYPRYGFDRTWRRLRWLPLALRAAIARSMRTIPEPLWAKGINLLAPVLPEGLNVYVPGRIEGIAATLSLATPQAMYRRMISMWKDPARLVCGAEEPPTLLADDGACPALATLSEKMMYLDSLTYLPDDILVKVDRASMAVSLEARVPMLDHRVVELAWRFPLSLKLRGGVRKWILRQVLYRHVPPALVERPKMGFAVPIDSWLRGPLREWAEDLLSHDQLARDGYIEPLAVQAKLREHLSGKRDLQAYLWNVLMFQAWLREQVSSSHGGAARSTA
jgi:asparagine synthase (glutamine-hydrolysing)